MKRKAKDYTIVCRQSGNRLRGHENEWEYAIYYNGTLVASPFRTKKQAQKKASLLAKEANDTAQEEELALVRELGILRSEYFLCDKSAENIKKGERIKEIVEILGLGAEPKKDRRPSRIVWK